MLRRALPWMLLLAAACTPKRVDLTREELAERRRIFDQSVAATAADAVAEVLERMEIDDGPFDVLVLSGGGPNGAFGAGFLAGWTDRPRFDLVTGVSVGALLAPYCLQDDEQAYDRLYEIFTNPDPRWARFRPVFALGGNALFDNAGLRRFIREEMDLEMVRGIRRAYREHRLLLVPATNLDLGLLRIWELGREADLAEETGSLDKLHSILLASSALPAAFPPVEIDRDLYVDGNTMAPMLMVTDADAVRRVKRAWDARHPGRPLPRLRIWIVVNSTLHVGAKTTRNRVADITARSLLTLTTALVLLSLHQFKAEVDLINTIPGVSCEMRYVAIPDDVDLPPYSSRIFEKERMAPLAERGRRMGADPASWRTEPPDLEWPGAKARALTKEPKAES